MICWVCGKQIHGADKKKVPSKGWIHKHHTSIKINVKQTENHGLKFKPKPGVNRAWGLNPERYTDEQLIRRMVQRQGL